MNRQGVTLIELLVTIVIGGIAFMALAVPFVAERTFWGSGTAQAESQRDAQVGLRAVARAMRQGSNPSLGVNAPASSMAFDAPCGRITFSGGPTFGEELRISGCGSTSTLIGGRSRVTGFAMTRLSDNLIRVQIDVLHRGRESEYLETQILMRNET
jgi:prepilin-type N-terminal cleavage/methylation domain-containing protein